MIFISFVISFILQYYRSIEFEYVKQQLEEKEKRLQEAEIQLYSQNELIEEIKSDNESLHNDMETMRHAVQNLANIRMNSKDVNEDTSRNNELIKSGNEMSNGTFIENSIEMSSSDMNKINYQLDTEHTGSGSMQEIQPSQRRPFNKILKKKQKRQQTKQMAMKRKYDILNEIKERSPLNRNEMKLLYDPKSFEKYAKELDIDIIKKSEHGYKKMSK